MKNMKWHMEFTGYVILLGQSFSAGTALANAYDLSWYTIDCGGRSTVIGSGYDFSGTIGQPDAGFSLSGEYSLASGYWLAHNQLTCVVVHECADADGNGIRDDACIWYDCEDSICLTTGIIFADMGGSFGACPPDGFVNLFDRNHALTCFASTNQCDSVNIDAGGAFGSCEPDGFCNLFDANHALTAFSGTNPCSCPTVPIPEAFSATVGAASLSVVSRRAAIHPGESVAVDVLVDGHLAGGGLQSYQLQLTASGGSRGVLELIDIRVEPRKDAIFAKRSDSFEAFNVARGECLLA